MSTEAAGEATHETVEAGREVTAVTGEANEAPDAAGKDSADPGPGREHDEGAAGPGASAGAEAAATATTGSDDDREPDPDGGPDEASAEADADDGAVATADEADDADGDADQADGDDEDPDEAAWPDDEDRAGDSGDLAYDDYDDDYDDYDDYADDAEGPDDGDTGRPRRWPRVLLVAGFVLAAAAIIGGALAIVGSVTHGFKKPVKVTYKKSALFALKTGDCFNPLGQAYTLTSCDDPHQAEVFATFALPGGKYPGSTAIAASAAQGCASRLTSYLNPQLAISLASTYVYPDATAWQAGTRTVICEVQASSGQLTGSVRGASATAG